MLPNTINSEELRRLTGYAKSSLVALEQDGIISRSAKDTWPVETLSKLFAHLRERKPAVSNERVQYEAARAQRERLKAEQLAGQLCRVSDFHTAWDEVNGQLITRLVALPARVTRDLALRRKWDEEIRQLRNEVSDYFRKRAAELGGGEAA